MILQVLGMLLLAAGLSLGYWQWSLLDGKTIVLGRVTALPESRNSKGGVSYGIVAEFRAGAGRAGTYRSSWKSTHPGYRVGDPIKLYYDRARPEDCGLCTPGARFGAALALALAGLALLAWRWGYTLLETWMAARYPAPPGT